MRLVPTARVLPMLALFATLISLAAPASRAAEVICTPDSCCVPKPAWTDTGFAAFTGKIAIQTREGTSPTDPVVTAFHLDSGIPPFDVNWDPPNGLMKRFSGYIDGSGFGHWRQGVLGSVFGITLDDAGNVYVCQTSAYNFDQTATLPGATPGGVYKIDAVTGNATTFATLPNAADPSVSPGVNFPCLGNITFDCRHRLLFVSNLEDGRIYRLDLAGNILSTFDHGTPDNGLPGWAPYGQRVWAVQWHNDNRLYYSLWNRDGGNAGSGPNEIWSVALDAVGNFVPGSAQLEITMPSMPSATYSEPVSDISFMRSGSILLAERAISFETYPGAHDTRVLRYDCQNFHWVPGSATYAISQYNNYSAAGGVDSDHDTYSGGTHGRVWVTGDALHLNFNDAIYGLQGLPPTGGNTTVSYLIDSNGDVLNQDKTNQGDVEVPCPVPALPDTGVIDGMKFWDEDCDGEKDPNEPGLSGWTIVITGPVNLTVQTAANGQYSFSNLPQGTYTICEMGFFGWQPTSPVGGCYTVTLGPNSIHNLNFANCRRCQSEQRCVTAPSNMVAWWPFDETSGTIAHDVRGLHPGTKVNGPGTCVRPGAGTAINLNGANQYVLVPNAADLNFGSSADFTIDAWINPAGNSTTNTILDKRVAGPVGWALALATGKLAFAMQDGSTASATYISPNVLPANTWTHVAIVVSRATNQGWAYVNGVLDGTFTPSTTAPGSINNAGALYIGRSFSGTNYWRGCIDDVEIFCRALSQAEIAGIVNFGKCKQYCSVPAVTTYPGLANTVTVNLTICNYDWSAPSTPYSWSVAGMPIGACTANGPTVITPNSGTVSVPAGTCVNIPVTITRPTGLTVGQTACYQFTVQNQLTQQCFGCTGTLRVKKKWWVEVDSVIHVIPTGTTKQVAIRVHNGGQPGTVADIPLIISEQVGSGDGLPAVSLNGLPPGEPILRTAVVPAGGVIVVPIDIGYGTCKGLIIDHIAIKMDEDQTGAFEDVAVMRVTQDSTASTVDVPVERPRTGPVQLTASPNPFRGSAKLQLTLEKETTLDVRVYDLSGRLVRQLYRGTRPAGVSPIVWDAQDDAGQTVRPGLYFVRVNADGLRMDARLVRIE